MTDAKSLVRLGFEKALAVQQPLARANVARLRRAHPEKSARELLKHLDRAYLGTVTATGAAAGATALVPGAGVPGAVIDMVAFTEASILYVLSCAEVHGLHPEDIERRRLLVMTVLMGDSATGALRKAVGRTGSHWAKRIVSSIPMTTINSVNKVLGPRFVTKYGTKQGLLVLSKQVPLGIGAALGGGGNHLIGRGVIASARKIFGEPPSDWGEVEQGGPVADRNGEVGMADIDKVWDRIKRHAGEEFQTINELPFIYDVPGNYLRITRDGEEINRSLSKTNFAKAMDLMPADGPGALRGRQGASYTWGILMDPRIRQSDW